MPRPNAASSARATGCAGARNAMLDWPPVTAAGARAAFGKHQRQRPRPERLGQLHGGRRHRRRPGARSAEAADVNDQRMGGGSALGREDAGDGERVAGVGAEPVDGFGRKRHQLARFQQGDRFLDFAGVRQHPRMIIGPLRRGAHSIGRRFQPVSVRRSS